MFLIRAGLNSLATNKLRVDVARTRVVLGLPGISTIAVWAGEEVDQVWLSDDRLRTRDVIWFGAHTALVAAGFRVVPTGLDPRHFTVVLPDNLEAAATTFRTLMTRRHR